MSKKHTIEYIKSKFDERGYFLISKVYMNAYTKLEYKCPNNHIGYMNWNKFSIGRGCPDCKRIKLKGNRHGFKHGKSYDPEFRKQHSKEYYKNNPWLRHFFSAKARCINPNNDHYNSYGSRGIKFLLTKEEIKELWFRDEAYNLKQASIDRKDNDGNYELSNCQFIEMEENSKMNRSCTPIIQYDLKGNFIKRWNSQCDIRRNLGFNQAWIGKISKRLPFIAYNFIWRRQNA